MLNLNVDSRFVCRGMKEVLKKRLKSYYKRQNLARAQVRPAGALHYDCLLVIDFEATCAEYNGPHYKHEIIEFPAVLVDCHSKKVVRETGDNRQLVAAPFIPS